MNRLEAQSYYEKLETLFKDFDRIALVTTDYETVFLKHQSLADITSLSQSAEVSNKYLNLQDGDIVLTNDPYSGGTILSSPTLIMGVGTKTVKGNMPAEFLIASRLTLTPKVGAFKTIDDEGLRIPPSPFYMKGEINAPIVEALKAHPLAPAKLTEKLTAEALRLLMLREKIKTAMHCKSIDLSKVEIKKYLKATENEFARHLDEIGQGSSVVELDLTEKETLKVKADHVDGHFTFDFTGTSTGEKIFICDTAVIGAAVGATVSFLNIQVPINSGILSKFDVRSPRGSMVNATFPRPLYMGHTDGLNAVAVIVRRAIGLIHKKYLHADSGISHCSYQILFRSGACFTDSLAVGAGGSPKHEGINGVAPWRKIDTRPSIESWESLFPIQVASTSYRPNSGGTGVKDGGMGMARSIKVLEEGELTWAFIHTPHQPQGMEGGRSALGTEMVLQRANGERESLPTTGTRKLAKGDIVTALSPGGGGFGAPKE